MNKRIVAASIIAVAFLSTRASLARADGDKEENDQKISLKEAPKAVRKTLNREAGDEKIKTVDKEKLNGKTVYEADVKIDGHNYEIVVSEDGLLLSKNLDEETDGKDADKKGSEKKESSKKASKEKSSKEKESKGEHEDKEK